jgi:TRAP-type C4-dicarboxylate transport system permease small subunit
MKKFNCILEKTLCGLTAVSAMGFFLIVLSAILLRRAGYSMDAGIELSRLSFVWSCFLAAAITYRRRAHVGFTVLYERLPANGRRHCSRLLHLLILLFMLLVLAQSLYVVFKLWPTRLPMLGISQSWLYMPLSISSVFMILFTLEFLAEPWDRTAARKPGSGPE